METLPNIDTCTWVNVVTDCAKPVSRFLLAVHFGQSMTTVVLACIVLFQIYTYTHLMQIYMCMYMYIYMYMYM